MISRTARNLGAVGTRKADVLVRISLTKVDVLVRFLSIRRNGNGTGVADGGFAQARADGDPYGLA
jgi:hypothetical protein